MSGQDFARALGIYMGWDVGNIMTATKKLLVKLLEKLLSSKTSDLEMPNAWLCIAA